MPHGKTIGHVTDDVMWPRKVKVVTSIYLGRIILTMAGEIQTWLQQNTYRKWHLEYQMVTRLVTSRDSEKSRSWPVYIWIQISRKRL